MSGLVPREDTIPSQILTDLEYKIMQDDQQSSPMMYNMINGPPEVQEGNVADYVAFGDQMALMLSADFTTDQGISASAVFAARILMDIQNLFGAEIMSFYQQLHSLVNSI